MKSFNKSYNRCCSVVVDDSEFFNLDTKKSIAMKLVAVVVLISILAKDLNGLNSASFAMDVIVVHQPDGSFKSSPFYVQFDKSIVQKSRTKTVRMKVNGRPSHVNITLDKNGRASFVRETAINEGISYNVPTDNELIHMTSEQIVSNP